jgi:4-amino-4-deoxy-L-arabinose transferase-like glycosyltransferase
MAVTAGHLQREIESPRVLGAMLDFATGSHARAVALLILVALISLLPGFFKTPPTDRDEARFAQASKQMVESHDYIDIKFQDEVRYKKPVGIYWLQAAAVKAATALGVERALSKIWIYRLPSLAGALGAVLLTYWAGLAFVTRRAAVLAAVMIATCVLVNVEGRLAKTDAALLAACIAAMGALARVYLPEQRKLIDARTGWTLAGIFWTALAAGVLIKGPVILMFVGLTVAALIAVDRSAGWLLLLRPLPGIIWLALLVLPWFLAIIARSGDSFFAESVGQDLLSKIVSGQESHGAPPGYYLVLFWFTFWPGATLAGLAAPAVWAARREPGAKFLLAWIVPAWIVFELVVTKLPHYVMPLYPAIAILIAGSVDARMLSRVRWLQIGPMLWFAVPVVLGIAGLLAITVIGRKFGLVVWPVVGGAIVMGLLAWRLYEVDGAEASLLRGATAAILVVFALCGLVIPSLTTLFPSDTLARILRGSDCAEPLVASAGYHEPSLVFLVGTETRLTDGAGAAEFLRGGPCRFAVIESHEQKGFAQAADAIGLRYSLGFKIDGFNMGSGRTASLSVYRSASEP